MIDEIDSLNEKGTWTLVKPPEIRRDVHGQRFPKIGNEMNKELLSKSIRRGFAETRSSDYAEDFDLTGKPETYSLVIVLVEQPSAHIKQLICRTAFLYSNVKQNLK